MICERDFGYLQLMDCLIKSNYNCVHLKHLLVETNAKQIWEQNQLFILFKSWDKKGVFCIVLFSMPYKACPPLQDFLYELGNLELICFHFASVAQVCNEDNFSGLENKHSRLIWAQDGQQVVRWKARVRESDF